MRIAIVAHGLANGGAERVASILANYLAGQKNDVLFIAMYSEKRDYELNRNIQFVYVKTYRKNPFLKVIERNKIICRELSAFKPDVTISFLTTELLLAVMKGHPVVFSLRNDPSHESSGVIYKKLRAYAYAHSQHVVFQTKGAQDYFSDKVKKKSSIIPNPLDMDQMPLWDFNNHNKSFITACRLNKQKNLPLMIKAFEKFHKEYPDYSLEIYGEGELRDELQGLIDDLRASLFIRLMGRRNDIHEIMSKSFAFVLSSL